MRDHPRADTAANRLPEDDTQDNLNSLYVMCCSMEDELSMLNAVCDSINKDRAKLQSALNFYADADNWEGGSAWEDKGYTAKTALCV